MKIVFTSAGNPKKYTQYLKDHGITVVHVVANQKFALKCIDAGVDAIVAEGFEAGGHNGREETTTFALIPMVKEQVKIPVIASCLRMSFELLFHVTKANTAVEILYFTLKILPKAYPNVISMRVRVLRLIILL